MPFWLQFALKFPNFAAFNYHILAIILKFYGNASFNRHFAALALPCLTHTPIWLTLHPYDFSSIGTASQCTTFTATVAGSFIYY